MIKSIKQLLKEEHAGFSGFTHWLIAIFLFFLMWLVPWSFANNYINAINSSITFSVLIFFVVGGASLLPDLDSSPLQGGGSTAIYQLGFLGNALSILCITISGVVYSIMHTRHDDKPKSQHRMLFHTFVIPICLEIYNYMYIPDSETRLINNLNIDNVGIMVIVFFAAISVYLGGSMLFYKVLSLIGRQRSTQFYCWICMLLATWQILYMPYGQLKLICTALSLGYAFHILGDMITKGSAPAFFPIPIPGIKDRHLKFWRKPYILGYNLSITTGGVVNIILNYILIGINIFLYWFIFWSNK